MKQRLLTAALALLSATAAFAGSATGTLTVNATVSPACVIAPGATLTFPNFNLVSAVTATVDISITCNNLLPYSVDLDLGATPNGTTRQMAGSSGNLEYSLNRPTPTNTDSGLVWGTGTNGISRTGTGSAQVARVFGTIPTSTNNAAAQAGSYTDTVGITVNF